MCVCVCVYVCAVESSESQPLDLKKTLRTNYRFGINFLSDLCAVFLCVAGERKRLLRG